MNFKNTAKLLKTARKKTGITQVVVAKNLGLKNSQFISNWERGICAAPCKYNKKLSTLLNVSTDDILAAWAKDKTTATKQKRS